MRKFKEIDPKITFEIGTLWSRTVQNSLFNYENIIEPEKHSKLECLEAKNILSNK